MAQYQTPKSFTATDSIIKTPCYPNGWDLGSLPSCFGNICWAEYLGSDYACVGVRVCYAVAWAIEEAHRSGSRHKCRRKAWGQQQLGLLISRRIGDHASPESRLLHAACSTHTDSMHRICSGQGCYCRGAMWLCMSVLYPSEGGKADEVSKLACRLARLCRRSLGGLHNRSILDTP